MLLCPSLSGEVLLISRPMEIVDLAWVHLQQPYSAVMPWSLAAYTSLVEAMKIHRPMCTMLSIHKVLEILWPLF